MRSLPGEVDRDVQMPQPGGEQRYVVTITGRLLADGAAATEAEAHRIAEAEYDRKRASLVREGEEIGANAELERVADILYAYHHAVVLNRGSTGLPPGTPLPRAADPVTMDRFREQARLWIGKTKLWRTAPTHPANGAEATAGLRGAAPGGAVVGG